MQVLHTAWPGVCVETVLCDVVYRGLVRSPDAKGAKPFPLTRRHMLPPDHVTLFRRDGVLLVPEVG